MAGWARARREGFFQVALLVAAVQVYEGCRRLLDPDWAAATANARRVVRLERAIHLDAEAWLQAVFLRLPELVQALNVFYFAGHFLVTGAFFWWLYRRSPAHFQVFRDGFLLATAASLIVHWRFPTAPPRLADVGLVDTLRVLSGIDIGSDEATSLYNPVAAVPSLHAAYAVGVGAGLALLGRAPVMRLLGLAYPPAVLVTIVVTGNHFVLDAVAGIAALAAGFALARVLHWAPRRGVEQSGSSPGS